MTDGCAKSDSAEPLSRFEGRPPRSESRGAGMGVSGWRVPEAGRRCLGVRDALGDERFLKGCLIVIHWSLAEFSSVRRIVLRICGAGEAGGSLGEACFAPTGSTYGVWRGSVHDSGWVTTAQGGVVTWGRLAQCGGLSGAWPVAGMTSLWQAVAQATIRGNTNHE
jgi:hypothetical protein